MGRLLSRLERLERRRLLEAIAEAHRRLGEVLDALSDRDMARLILAVTEAYRPVEGDLDAESQAFAGVFGAAPAAVAGLSYAAKEGAEAWRAAGGCEAWAFGMAALGDAPTDEELARAVGEARTRFCRPEFHKARARPYLRGLPWGG